LLSFNIKLKGFLPVGQEEEEKE